MAAFATKDVHSALILYLHYCCISNKHWRNICPFFDIIFALCLIYALWYIAINIISNHLLKSSWCVFSALKSHGKSATFRQHYYPEGGWGWVITFCCFLVNIFTTGLQLSFSILYLKILQHCESEVGPEDKISIGKYLHT